VAPVNPWTPLPTPPRLSFSSTTGVVHLTASMAFHASDQGHGNDVRAIAVEDRPADYGINPPVFRVSALAKRRKRRTAWLAGYRRRYMVVSTH
jgi:hypothetical protein